MDGAKTRVDAWWAGLDEAACWELYDRGRALRWPVEVVAELERRGLDRLPGRTAWYDFLAHMRRRDAQRRIERIAQSAAEAQGVADRAGIKSAVMVETLKALAIDRAMDGDDKGAQGLAAAAAGIWEKAQREKELELKARAQETKDAALKLAREKFEAAERRLAQMAAVADAARGGKVDPAKVADEIDRILGRVRS